jgi:hypothetical protein
MQNGADHLGPYNLNRPRGNVLSILRLHDSVDEAKHLHPVPTLWAVAGDGGVVAVKVAGRNDRTVVPELIEFPHIGKNGRVRAQPDVTGVEETGRSRIVKVAEALPGAPAVSLKVFLNRQEHDLMAAFEKFKSKIDIMEKCSAQVGHFPAKEQDFHYVYASTRFV